MPRAFTFRLSNQSPFPLLRVGEPSLDGDWTPKPPERIEPGQEVEWGTTSDKVGRGTDGSVFYEVDLAGSNALSTEGAGIFFGWDVPFIGAPDFSFRYEKRSDILAATDRSREFQLVPTSSGDPGSESAEDVAAAVFLGPFSLLHVNHLLVAAVFRSRPGGTLRKSRAALEVELPKPVATALTAVLHPTLSMWSGAWAYRDVDGARLAVTVEAAAAGFDLTASERSGAPATASAVRARSERLPVYRGDVWPATPIAKKPVGGLVHIPLPDAGEVTKPAPVTPPKFRPRLKGNDVLPLREDVLLELYDEKTVPAGEHVRFRLRYVGLAAGGNARIDVMLQPHTPIR